MLTDRLMAAIKSRRERKESKRPMRGEIQQRFLREILDEAGTTSVSSGRVTVSKIQSDIRQLGTEQQSRNGQLRAIIDHYREAIDAQRAYADHLEEQLRQAHTALYAPLDSSQGHEALRAVAAGDATIRWVEDGIPNMLTPARAREILAEIDRPPVATSVNKNLEQS